MKRILLLIIILVVAALAAVAAFMLSSPEEPTSVTLEEEPKQAAVLSCAQPAVSFGTIREADGLVEHKFLITNTGNAALLIISCEGSCGCTTAEWTQEPIAPGASGFVSVAYDPQGVDGTFVKEINVISNATTPLFKLTVKGEVIASK